MERRNLERYFNNTCTQEERERVELWLSKQNDSEVAKDDITRFWEEFQNTSEAQEAEASGEFGRAPSFDDVWKRINMESDTESARMQPRRRPSEKLLYVAAACIGFLVTLGVLVWTHQRSAITDVAYITVQTNKGERKWVTLSDGSEVFLNADSRLTYPQTMDLHQAAIYIEGEAFFNMTESDKPRVIKAGGLEAWAGERSKFNISAFPSDSTVTVAVDEGRAEIRNGYGPLLKLRIPGDKKTTETKTDSVMPLIKLRPAVVMKQRESAVVHKGRGEMAISETLNDRKAFGWKDGILYFDEVDSLELINQLERWYGVKVDVCSGGLPDVHYSAEFDNADIVNVLAQMSQIIPIDYQIVGSTVFLCGK